MRHNGIVVVTASRHRHQGWCTCGWRGRRRVLLASAKIDALVHAARDGCAPGVPLIQPRRPIAVTTHGHRDSERRITATGRDASNGLRSLHRM